MLGKVIKALDDFHVTDKIAGAAAQVKGFAKEQIDHVISDVKHIAKGDVDGLTQGGLIAEYGGKLVNAGSNIIQNVQGVFTNVMGGNGGASLSRMAGMASAGTAVGVTTAKVLDTKNAEDSPETNEQTSENAMVIEPAAPGGNTPLSVEDGASFANMFQANDGNGSRPEMSGAFSDAVHPVQVDMEQELEQSVQPPIRQSHMDLVI